MSWRGRALRLRATVRDFTLITHAVAASRLRARLPAGLTLDTRVTDEGLELAFISTASFVMSGLRLAYLPFPRLTFRQVTYRACVRHLGRPGVYFLGAWIEKRPALLAEGWLMPGARRAHFTVRQWEAPAGHRVHEHRVRRGDVETRFLIELPAPPEGRAGETAKGLDGLFAGPEELSRFLTDRPHGFFSSRLRRLEHTVAEHEPMHAVPCGFYSGRFGFWEEQGILDRGGEAPPLSAHYAAETEFSFLFPESVGSARDIPQAA